MKVTTDACLFGAIIAHHYSVNTPAVALDIGTGTGLLSLMVAQKQPHLQIDSIEVEAEACSQARENVMASPWADRIQVMEADILSYEIAKKYDLIFTNPPFYENDLRSPDEKKNRAHHNEDLSLLDWLKKSRSLLKDDGEVWLLLTYKRKNELLALLRDTGFRLKKIFLARHTEAHEYFRIIVAVSPDDDPDLETSIEEISIFDEGSTYSYEFVQLLRHYYLKL